MVDVVDGGLTRGTEDKEGGGRCADGLLTGVYHV